MDADRRRRFIALFKSKRFNSNREKLIEQSGLSKGRVSQLFDPNQAFGERAARALAESLDLPPNYFEHDAAPEGGLPPAPPPADFADRHQVTKSQWDLLQEIENALLLPSLAKRLEEIREEARILQAAWDQRADQIIKERIEHAKEHSGGHAGGMSIFGDNLGDEEEKPAPAKKRGSKP